MINREELIKKATLVIVSVYGEQVEDTGAVARTLLDMFEEGQAPTDHEWEALARAWDRGMAYGVNYDAGDYEVAPEPIENPYEEEKA